MDRHIICNKQPILDADQTLHSYSYALEPIVPQPMCDEAWQDEARDLFEEIDQKFGLDTLAGPHYCFYCPPCCLLAPEMIPPLSDMNRLVVEIDTDILGKKQVLEHIKALKARGMRLCMANYVPDPQHDKLLPIVEFVKLNRSTFDHDTLMALHDRLSSTHTVIVTHVEDMEQFDALKQAGVRMMQGFYFVNPITTHDKELGVNETSVLQLLAEINRDDTDFDKLADIIRADVSLSHHLLTAINHPANDLPRRVESIKDALQLMGLKRLKFWVTMMVMSQTGQVPLALMQTSLVRARFLELIAENSSHKREKEAFFLVGLFSTLNAFFHLPMVDIVAQLPLADNLKAALTDHAGDMGQALRIEEMLERGTTCWETLRFEHLDIIALSNLYMEAHSWAHALIKTLHGGETRAKAA